MPTVVRGSLAGLDDVHTAVSPLTQVPSVASHVSTPASPKSRPVERRESSNYFQRPTTADGAQDQHALDGQVPARHVAFGPDSADTPMSPRTVAPGRRSGSFFRNNKDARPVADAYYDSRAATRREYKRRATTLQEYYHDHPDLLPQLPFTWHRGKKRWRLWILIALLWLDACVVPIILYYALHYTGVEGWIIFAIVTTIWGGPTYLEFGLRTLKLMKKERFYRPLGTNSRWCFDYTEWVSVAVIFVVTTLFIVGSAPHNVWLRVLCMPMPAMLYVLGIMCGMPTLYSAMGWKAPFRLSSTPKGGEVLPAVYYIMEDAIAVNANAGRPYREALAARYAASPRFRRMIYVQSLFWSIPPIIIAIPLTVISVINPVPANVSYAICWAVPFIWATVWGIISWQWCKRDMRRERLEWQRSAPLSAKQKEAEQVGLGESPSPDSHTLQGSGEPLSESPPSPSHVV